MRLRDYIKDKLIDLLFVIVLYLMILFLLTGFNVNHSLTFAITILYVVMMSALFIYEYYRKKSFYDLLRKQVEELDQKYLLHAMLYEPNFYEGKLLYDALYQGNKAMKEKINIYQESMEDFKEYIELWIHEIKTPLSSGLLTLHNHNYKEGDKLVDSFHKMDDYMEQVLYYVRSENPETDYLIKELNLKTIINKIVVKNKDSFIHKKIKLELQDLDVHVHSDMKWLEFIINQIIQNSIKYCNSQKSCITIGSNINSGIVKLSIKDNGIGVSKSNQSRVFEKGFTGDNGRKISHSTGMGLYICKRLCDKLGHTIELTSTLNEGTCVTISFLPNTYYDVLK